MKKIIFLFSAILIVINISPLYLGFFWHIKESSNNADGDFTISNDFKNMHNLNLFEFQNGFIDFEVSYDGTFGIDDKFNLYSWGINHYGKLGHGNTTNYYAPKLVEALANEKVIKVSSLYYHTLVLTASGDVYSFGRGLYGALGHQNGLDQYTPKKINYILNATDIAAGDAISIILANDKVYAAGTNANGALGLPYAGNEVSREFHEISYFTDKSIIRVYSTNNSFLALSSDNTLYTWGANNYGQLGNATNTSTHIPQIVNLNNEAIQQIDTGYYHTLVLTQESVYGFGLNNDYQLGNNDNVNKNIPTKIDFSLRETTDSNQKIVSIGAGSDFSFLILENSSIYAWGENFYGTLCFPLGDANDKKIPTYNETLTNNSLFRIKGGYGHGVGITIDGKVFSFGYNSNGQLGLGGVTANEYGKTFLIRDTILIEHAPQKLMENWCIEITIQKTGLTLSIYTNAKLTEKLMNYHMPNYELSLYLIFTYLDYY